MKICGKCSAPIESQREIHENRCRRCISGSKREYKTKNPWVVMLSRARQRCEYPKSHGYSRYGGRGIRCVLTIPEVKMLWERDGAANMKKPSLDRINKDGNYVLENCRIIEHSENAKQASQGIPWRQRCRKLSPEQLQEIRDRPDIAAPVLAKKFGVSPQAVRRIRGLRAVLLEKLVESVGRALKSKVLLDGFANYSEAIADLRESYAALRSGSEGKS